MKKKIFSMLKALVLGLALSLSSAGTGYAAVDNDALQGYLNAVVSQEQINQSNNPKYADRSASAETVDPITGNLILKQNDLYLPGRDGLDLSVGRIYNSSQNECDKKVSLSYSVDSRMAAVNGYACDVYFYHADTDSWEKYIQYFSNQRDAYAFYAANQTSTDNTIYTLSPYAVPYQEYQDYYTVTVNNYTDKYSYNKIRYYLGAGWSFSFPSIQFESNSGYSAIYYHDGKGSAYQVTGFMDTGTSNLEGYQGNDVKLLLGMTEFVGGDGTFSHFKFIDSDLTKTYFAQDGRILGIRDRFNNEIKFWYTDIRIYQNTYPLISKIQDSVGRVINFSYSSNSIVLTVSAPNEANQLSITYAKSLAHKTVFVNGTDIESYAYPVLDSVTDTLGRTTYYENYYNYNGNTWPSVKFLYNSKNIGNGAKEEFYLLGAVVYPGSKTFYEYEKTTRNLGADGAAEAYRIKSRYDRIQRHNIATQSMEWLPAMNKADYTYGGDYTGYPDYLGNTALPEAYRFWSQVKSSSDILTKTTFNGFKQNIQVETTAGNNEKTVMKNLEFYGSYRYLPAKIETSQYAGDGTLARTLYTEYVYNTWGGLNTSTLPLTPSQYNDQNTKALYTTTYRYEDPNYKYFLTKKQWYQNSTSLLQETYSYDSLGRVLNYTNPKGEVTSYSYYNEANNRITESTRNLESGKTAKTKLVYGSETGYAYPKEEIHYYTNDSGVYTQTKTGRTYHLLLGLVKTETDNENKTMAYTYDNAGRIILVQQPDFTNTKGVTYSVRQAYEYMEGYNWDYTEGNYHGIYGTTVNSSTRYTNKGNNTTSYYNQTASLYDAYGNLRQERLWEGAQYVTKSRYTYDNLQRIISYSDAAGNTVTQNYNPWGQVKEVADPSGNLYFNEYDIKNNRIISFFVAAGNIPGYRANPAANTLKENYIEEALDQFGRTISRKVYQNWPTASGELSELYSYDIAGNLTGYKDPKRNVNEDGFTYTYRYDALNRITLVKDALNQVTNVAYTALGNISSVTMKQTIASTDTVTLYTKAYDELGAVKSKTDPSAQAEQYSYNTTGLLTGSRDRNGSTATLTYDGLGQLAESRQTSTDGQKSIRYRYSISSPFGYEEKQLYTDGQLTTAEQYTYGADGQVTGKDVTGSGYINSGLKLQYDAAGRLTGTGAGVQGTGYFYSGYTYTAGRLTRIQTNGQQTLSTSDRDNASYEYYPDGKLKKITYPRLDDGTFLTTEYTYNAIGRLTSMVNKKGGSILSQYAYTYDANGNIVTVNDGTTTRTYVYDKLNRLISILPQTGKATVYSYDLRGNRLTESSDRISLSFENTGYAYRLDNRLETATKGTAETGMAYYADGLRAKKTTSAGTIHYIYDLAGRVVAEGQSTTAVNANYVWGPDRVLSKKDSGGEYYYLYNGHGDVIQIVDRNGNVVNNYKYDEWGNILESNETISNPFKYAGEVYDEETGLYYLRARYYDPSVGRFLNEDIYEGQVNNPLTLNLYTYCFNNPGIYIDRSGNFPFLVVTGLIGAVVGGIGGGIYSYYTYGEVRWQDVAGGAAIGGAIGLTGGAAAAYITAGSALASTGAVATGAAAMYASASAIVIKGVNDLWDKGAVVRGRIIEEYLGGMGNNFPVIDKFVLNAKNIASSITSIKSIDLFAKSYQAKDAVYNTVMKYVNSLFNFTDTAWGVYTVNVNESTQRILELAIPANAGIEQMEQVYRAVADAAKFGIEVVIKVFK